MDLIRFFHTVKYLKPVQIYGRLWFKLNRPRPDISPAPAARSIKANWINPCKKNPSLFSPYRFRFLNQEHELNSVNDWNNPQWEKLWLYNLHYFDDLQACDAENKKALHLDLIKKWIEENPPGMGNGWESYPLSLRIVNWIKWVLDGNSLPNEVLHSLAVQTRYLFKKLEVHLLGNHLFANAKALVFAGFFFGDNEAELWLNKGLKILSKQIPEQILDDGGHFERSPMYHSIILEDLLDIFNILQAYKPGVNEIKNVEKLIKDNIEKMMLWLKVMCHPDKQISFFNDAAFGIAPEPIRIEGYALRLGLPAIDPFLNGITRLPDSGYVRLQKGDAVLIADVGEIGPDYLPGHAHADILSFEFSYQGKRIFVNSGTSCYGNSMERLLQRSTASHNTLMIDRKDSSEVWNGFRVARRAYPSEMKVDNRGGDSLRLICAHNGYQRLKGKPIHCREWVLNENSLAIRDRISGDFSEAMAFYHLYPELAVDTCNKRIFSDNISMFYETDADVFIEKQHYYPEFGKAVPNECFVVKPVRNEYYIKFERN